jgi:hypothetical protein
MHARTGCLILAAASAVAAAAAEQVPVCLDQLFKPVYPPLAAMARVQGVVQARFWVDPDGRVFVDSVQGHRLLTRTIEQSQGATHLDSLQCGGQEFKVVYRFEIGDAIDVGGATKVTFESPDAFRVFRGSPGIICILYTRQEVRSVWWKRIFRRGLPAPRQSPTASPADPPAPPSTTNTPPQPSQPPSSSSPASAAHPKRSFPAAS